ncbi:hypothetical protein [Limnoglobus roseus]|uniref:Uncharacterized protein n=1 Tax=Limnoglobus roseus TaxID=2598579 RepID=A0A5C1A9D1_9BACT|nr:hypothetical protein [Limnoglobus roseus]QEL13678.1 hypothetical protein PX52LOC_00536 [Limnoglobus roseus]
MTLNRDGQEQDAAECREGFRAAKALAGKVEWADRVFLDLLTAAAEKVCGQKADAPPGP